jgi:hypothetical protein
LSDVSSALLLVTLLNELLSKGISKHGGRTVCVAGIFSDSRNGKYSGGLTHDQDVGGEIGRGLLIASMHSWLDDGSCDNFLLLRVSTLRSIIALNSNKAQLILVAFHN